MEVKEMVRLLTEAADPEASDDEMLGKIIQVVEALELEGKPGVVKRLMSGAGEVVASMWAGGAKQTPTLVVELKGGLVESIYATEPMRCIILDYDTDFVTQDDVTVTDEDGRIAYPRIFQVEAAPQAIETAEKLVEGIADED